MSIALNLIDLATEEARKAGASRVEQVRVRVGVLSGVIPEALHSAFEVAKQNTSLEHAQLIIEKAPVKIYCSACGCESTIEGEINLRCPRCGQYCGEVIQGREMELISLTIIQREEHYDHSENR